jgi:DNA-binding transcriptional LysR family regulator
MFNLLPLNALRSFEAVARHESFTRAADELSVTQSAVSHQVRQLEAWLGGSLIDRKGQTARVLPHGIYLATVLTSALKDINHACKRARETTKDRNLTIAVIPSVATCWLIPQMPEFRALHGGIRTRILYAIHGQNIDFSEVDFGIVYAHAPFSLPGTRAYELMPGDSAPVCSHSFLDAHGSLTEPDQILSAGLLHDTDVTGWKSWLSAVKQKPTMLPDGAIYEDFNLLRAAALAGEGVALCPLSLIHDDIQGGRLVQLSDVKVLSDYGYFLVESDDAAESTRSEVIQFRDWIFSLVEKTKASTAPASIRGHQL